MPEDVNSAVVHDAEREMLPPGSLTLHPRNPRRGDIDTIVEMMRANGFYGVVVRQKSTGFLIKGNHTAQAAARAGIDLVPVDTIDVDDATALRILLGDNRASDLAFYDNLGEILVEQRDAGNLHGTGFDDDDVEMFSTASTAAPSAEDTGDGDEDVADLAMLRALNVTITDPRTVPVGSMWRLGDRHQHHLCIVDVMSGWPTWVPLLTDGALFVPYPSLYVPLSETAEDHDLVMVQPDPYLAGLLIEALVSVRGETSVVQIS